MLEEEYKVSIVMPVYNVEKFVGKSITSVLNQTYTNWELIVVNDGSTDSSLSICEQYGRKDSRIKIYTQKNAGLSAACNKGAELASGDYLAALDSDDYYESEMLAKMITAIDTQNAQIAVCGHVLDFEDHSETVTVSDTIIKIDKLTALKKLIGDKTIRSYRWNKLIRMDIAKSVTHPVGKSFEDIYTMHEIFSKADKVVLLPDVLYHYVQRSGSIIYGGGGKQLDVLEAYEEQLRYIKVNHPELTNLSYMNCISQCITLLQRDRDNFRSSVVAFYRKNINDIMLCKSLKGSFKLKALVNYLRGMI